MCSLWTGSLSAPHELCQHRLQQALPGMRQAQGRHDQSLHPSALPAYTCLHAHVHLVLSDVLSVIQPVSVLSDLSVALPW